LRYLRAAVPEYGPRRVNARLPPDLRGLGVSQLMRVEMLQSGGLARLAAVLGLQFLARPARPRRVRLCNSLGDGLRVARLGVALSGDLLRLRLGAALSLGWRHGRLALLPPFLVMPRPRLARLEQVLLDVQPQPGPENGLPLRPDQNDAVLPAPARLVRGG